MIDADDDVVVFVRYCHSEKKQASKYERSDDSVPTGREVWLAVFGLQQPSCGLTRAREYERHKPVCKNPVEPANDTGIQ
jgi:hypothetical protein